MTQAINVSLILLILGFTVWRYVHNYRQGLITMVFLLLCLPDSLEIQITLSMPSFTIHRLLLLVAAIAWWLNPRIRKSGSKIPFFSIQIAIAAAYLLSTLLSYHFLVSAKRYLYYLSESLLFFWILQTSITDRRFADRIFRAAAHSLLLVAAIAYVERYTGIRVFQILPRLRQAYDFESLTSLFGRRDIASTYNHRILFGVGCAVCLACFLITMSTAQRNRKRYHWLGCLIAAGALYFSNSRGPWVSFAGGLALLTMLFPGRFLKTTAFLSVAAMLVMVVRPGTYVTLRDLSSSTLDKETLKGSSFRWRLTVFNMAYSKIAEADLSHALFGFGGGSHVFLQFGEVELSTGRKVTMESWDSEISVNLFEQGLVGIALIVLLYARFSARTILFIKRRRLPDDALVFALVCVVIILLSKMTVRIFTPQLVYLEAIGLAISSSYLQRGRFAQPDERVVSWKPKETSPLT